MICKSRFWRQFQIADGVRRSSCALLYGCVIALVPYGNLFAQPSAAGPWPGMDRWSMGPDMADPGYSRVYDEPGPFEDARGAGRPHISPTVTLHELSHHIPGRAAKEYERAVNAGKRGENDKAIAYYKRAIAADPEFAEAINDLGVAYLRSNSIELAVEEFTKAIAVDPHAPLPYDNLANAYLRERLFVDAERTARRGIDLDRVGSYGPLILGVSLILQGNFTPEAERSLSKAAGEYEVAKMWLALALAGRGDLATAKEHLRAYIAQASDDGSKVANNLLQELESAGQTDGAPGRRSH